MHKKKWIRNVMIIAVILVICAFFAVSNILVDVALVPEKMEQTQAFSDLTQVSMEALVQTSDIKQNQALALQKTGEWTEAADTEKLSVTTKDGYQLIGQVFLQKQESHKWVVLLHGYTGWKEELFPIGYEYAQRGYQVLAPDMRCNGESEGDFIGMGWTDRLDNLLWLDYILKQDPEAEIVLHGQSMGASCALMMTGEMLPEQVKAVISDSAYTDVYSMFKKQMKEWFHLPAFPLLDSAGLMLRLRGGYRIKDASALEAVKKSQIPILLIHGTDDAFIPVEMAEELYEAANGKKELLLIEGAGHVQAQDKAPQKYYDTVFEFLAQSGIE